jgi:hypothetical protein
MKVDTTPLMLEPAVPIAVDFARKVNSLLVALHNVPHVLPDRIVIKKGEAHAANVKRGHIQVREVRSVKRTAQCVLLGITLWRALHRVLGALLGSIPENVGLPMLRSVQHVHRDLTPKRAAAHVPYVRQGQHPILRELLILRHAPRAWPVRMRLTDPPLAFPVLLALSVRHPRATAPYVQ